MLNKKGEKLMSIWWIACIVFVTLVVVISIVLNYTSEMDSRKIRAELLSDRIFGCIVEERGFILEEFFTENFDIFYECNLEKELFAENSGIFFEIEVIGEKNKNISEGNLGFKVQCEQRKLTVDDEKYYVKCSDYKTRVFYFIEEEKKILELNILTASEK